MKWFNVAKHKYSIEDLAGMALKVMVLSSYSFNADHATVTGMGATEFSGTGYTGGYGGAGRKTIANLTAVRNDAAKRSELHGDDLEIGKLGGSAAITGIAIIFETGGSDATAIPIAYDNTHALNYTATGALFKVLWPSTGLLFDYTDHGLTAPAGRKFQAYHKARHEESLESLAGLTLKALLVKSTYTFDPEDEYVADIAAHECSGTGYARQTLTTVASNADNANDRGELDSDNISFGSGLNFGTAAGCVIFADTGSDATSRLVCYFGSEAGFPVVTDGSGKTLLVTIDAEGFLNDY